MTIFWLLCRECDGTHGRVLELGTICSWGRCNHDHQSRITAVCARVHSMGSKGRDRGRTARAFLEMADAWTRVALVDRVTTAQFAGDVNGAEQPIHF
jgi:hypothetical protein